MEEIAGVSWLLCGVAILGSACGPDSLDDPPPRRTELALEVDAVTTECGESVSPDMLDLTLLLDHATSDDGAVTLDEGEDVVVLVESGSAGLASIEARVSTGLEDARNVSSSVALDGLGPARLAFSSGDLGLPAERRSWSSRLAFSARLDGEKGLVAAAGSLELWLHREGNGWLIYDSAVRDARFGAGALDEAAVAIQQTVARNARPGSSTDGPPIGVVRDAPLGWLPVDEAPPEEGEVER